MNSCLLWIYVSPYTRLNLYRFYFPRCTFALFPFLVAELEADEGIESLASTDGYLHSSHVYMSPFHRQGISQFCLILIG